MSLRMYEINAGIEACVDAETGEILDEEKLEALELARDEKIEGVALWIKNLEADAKAIKEEAANLTTRAKAKENKAASLRAWLAHVLDGEKFETPKVRLSWRKSDAVMIEDEDLLPEVYKKITIAPDKAGIRKALKAGEEIQGAYLTERQNLILK